MSTPLLFPNKSHRKQITTPEYSNELAEFFGIVFGDGGISTPWQCIISLNSVRDKDYVLYIRDLVIRLFGLVPAIRDRRGKYCTVVVCSSVELVEFLIRNGVSTGNKVKKQFDMPEWIRANSDYSRMFVRGMIDTDGILYIHRHTCLGHVYRNIGLCFSSYSKPLLHSVHSILENAGIYARIHSSGNKLYVYRASDVQRYLDIFGSSNPRMLTKYQDWRGVRVA